MINDEMEKVYNKVLKYVSIKREKDSEYIRLKKIYGNI